MKRIGIIGFGNMGQAIAEQLKGDYTIYCFDKDITKSKDLSGIEATKTMAELVNKAEVVILAVKPQDFESVLEEIKSNISTEKLFISIAAGISTAYIEKKLGVVRVIRTMPNIAIKIGQGMSCLSKGRYASQEDFDFAENLFDYLGETQRIDEAKMDAATAVSGSGPGFCFQMSLKEKIDTHDIDQFRKFVEAKFIPSLKQAAQSVGFSAEEAEFLSVTTGNSCSSLLVKTKLSPEELRKQVTSQGGTTEAGLEALDKTGSLTEAVKAALARAIELSGHLAI